MLIYRNLKKIIPTRERLAEVRLLAGQVQQTGCGARDTVRELLISIGEMECGVADSLCPEADSDLPVLRAFRHAGLLAGRLLACCSDRCLGRAGELSSRIVDALRECAAFELPGRLEISVPEGYAFYGLYPEMYLRSAARFHGEKRPAEAVCLGIRSIGTSLGYAVAGQLENLGCRTHSFTVRPHGHPFDREIRLLPELEAKLGAFGNLPFLIIDEGPGLSGSSFCGTARKIVSLGVTESNIFLFPGWEPEHRGFVSESARRLWPRFEKYSTSFDEIREKLDIFKHRSPDTEIREISAGGWRSLLYARETDYPAVQQSHEKRKYLIQPVRSLQTGEIKRGSAYRLLKFCGLGRYGRGAFERACILAGSGFHPPVKELCDGFLGMDFIPGTPGDCRSADSTFLERAGAYFGFIDREFPSREATCRDQILEMIEINIAEGLGPEWERYLEPIRSMSLEVECDRPVYLDNRVFPHEWVKAGETIYKLDGAEHFEDHFFPGPQDICWDLAGFSVEFGLGGKDRELFLKRFAAGSGRAVPSVEKLAFYSVAYLSFRMGYCAVAASSLSGTEDGRAFRSLYEKYASLLKETLVSIA